MPTAAYCDQCQDNVYVTADGTCPKGHGAECLSGHYEAGAEAAAPTPAATSPTLRPMVKTARWVLLVIIIVVLLAIGCGFFACTALLTDNESDVVLPEEPATPAPADPVAPTEEAPVEAPAPADPVLDGWYAEGAEETDYVTSRAEIELSASEAMNRLAETYPATNANEKATCEDAFAALETAYADAIALSPPAKYMAIHDYFVIGLGLSDQGWQLAADNDFAELDGDAQAQAASNLDEAATQFQQMDAAIAALETVWGSE